MTAVGFVFPQLAVQFADGDVRIPAVVIADPLQFLFGVGVGVRSMRFVGFVLQGFLCSVLGVIPAHQGGF